MRSALGAVVTVGDYQHRIVVVTCYSARLADRVEAAASRWFQVTLRTETFPLTLRTESQINGWHTVIVPPCGSKVGWEANTRHEKNVDEFAAWLDASGAAHHWIVASYGDYGSRLALASDRDESGACVPQLAEFVIQARNTFKSQYPTHGAPMGRAQLAAFDNAITPLCIELEEAWAALADMKQKNAQAAADLAELNRRLGRKVFGDDQGE